MFSSLDSRILRHGAEINKLQLFLILILQITFQELHSKNQGKIKSHNILFRFEDVHHDALAYLFSPLQEWANLDDCGDFPCSAPLNALLNFENTVYAGTVRPRNIDKHF